jgi:hypothetical protein
MPCPLSSSSPSLPFDPSTLPDLSRKSKSFSFGSPFKRGREEGGKGRRSPGESRANLLRSNDWEEGGKGKSSGEVLTNLTMSKEGRRKEKEGKERGGKDCKEGGGRGEKRESKEGRVERHLRNFSKSVVVETPKFSKSQKSRLLICESFVALVFEVCAGEKEEGGEGRGF